MTAIQATCSYCGKDVVVQFDRKRHLIQWEGLACPGPVDLSSVPNEIAGAW